MATAALESLGRQASSSQVSGVAVRVERYLTTVMPAMAIAVAVLNGVVLMTAIAKQTHRGGLGDWAILLSPVIAVFVCVALSASALRAGRMRSALGRATLWGSFVGCFLFLLLQAVMTVPRYSLIAADGTAYWALAILPAVYLGVPLLLLGGIFGLGTGALLAARRKRQDAS